MTEETIQNNNKEYKEYFDSSDKGKHRQYAVAWLGNTQNKNYELVARHIHSGESLLDYGCGLGDFYAYLDIRGKSVSNYLGVDINPDFIMTAKNSYPNNQFKLIRSVDELTVNMDTICAIGVFTWYITKEDFIECIEKLYERCNKQVLITCIRGSLHSWDKKYRTYNEEVFDELFPNYNIEYDYSGNTLLVKINKSL